MTSCYQRFYRSLGPCKYEPCLGHSTACPSHHPFQGDEEAVAYPEVVSQQIGRCNRCIDARPSRRPSSRHSAHWPPWQHGCTSGWGRLYSRQHFPNAPGLQKKRANHRACCKKSEAIQNSPPAWSTMNPLTPSLPKYRSEGSQNRRV